MPINKGSIESIKITDIIEYRQQ